MKPEVGKWVRTRATANRCAAALMAAAALLSAPCKLPAQTASNVYRNSDELYQFQPPAGWEQKPDMPKLITAYLGPVEGDFTVNLTVSVYTSRVDDGDLDKFVKDIKIEHGDITNRVKTTLGGRKAWAWRTKLTIPGHPKAENRQVVCIYNHRAYELAMTTPYGLMKSKYDSVFEKWVGSFVWLNPIRSPRK